MQSPRGPRSGAGLLVGSWLLEDGCRTLGSQASFQIVVGEGGAGRAAGRECVPDTGWSQMSRRLHSPACGQGGQGPAGPRVGSGWRCRVVGVLLLVPAPLVGRAGLEACEGSVEEGGQCLPTGGSWPLGGQGRVQRQLWALWSLGSLSADGRGCVPAQMVVWPELAQHWHAQVTGRAGLGANELQQVRRTWPRTTPATKVRLEPNPTNSSALS